MASLRMQQGASYIKGQRVKVNSEPEGTSTALPYQGTTFSMYHSNVMSICTVG